MPFFLTAKEDVVGVAILPASPLFWRVLLRSTRYICNRTVWLLICEAYARRERTHSSILFYTWYFGGLAILLRFLSTPPPPPPRKLFGHLPRRFDHVSLQAVICVIFILFCAVESSRALHGSGQVPVSGRVGSDQVA